MSEIVDDFPGRQGRPPSYPWEEWMDGAVHKLHHDEDFPYAQVTSFRVRAHQVAKDYGLKVKTQIKGDDIIFIQFYEPDEEE